jgi:hypothetical protein
MYLVTRDYDYRVAWADEFFVYRKLDNRCVAIIVSDRFELECICVETQRLRK